MTGIFIVELLKIAQWNVLYINIKHSLLLYEAVWFINEIKSL